MNHLPLIIKREYLTKVRNKSFILMTFLTPLIMIALFLFVGYLSSVNNDTVRTIYVLDETDFLSESFKTNDQTILTTFLKLIWKLPKHSPIKKTLMACFTFLTSL